MWWNSAGSTAWPTPWMFFGPVMMVIFVIACIAVIGLMLRGGTRAGHDGDPQS